MASLEDKPPPDRSPRRSADSSPRRGKTLTRKSPVIWKDTPSSNFISVNGRKSFDEDSGSSKRSYERGSSDVLDLHEFERFIAKRASRASTQLDKCFCPIHQGAMVAGRCKHRRRITRAEIMEKETKLVVLEYLSSLTSSQLTARNASPDKHDDDGPIRYRPPASSQEATTTYNKAAKAHTVNITDSERQKLLEDIQAAGRKRATRSNSDATEEQRGEMRRKFRLMQEPIKQWMDLNLRREIHGFDPHTLRPTPTREHYQPVMNQRRFRTAVNDYLRQSKKRSKTKKVQKTSSEDKDAIVEEVTRYIKSIGDGIDVEPQKVADGQLRRDGHFEAYDGDDDDEVEVEVDSNHRDSLSSDEDNNDQDVNGSGRPESLTIHIPRRSVQIAPTTVELTPETFVVNRLETISQEIMFDYPGLLQQPIENLLTPLDRNRDLSYEAFHNVAKEVYNQDLARGGSMSVWSRVALVLYFVRETMFQGNLDDTQLEAMVNHSTKFVTEHAYHEVQKEGGWVMDHSMLVGQYDYSSCDECLTDEDEVDGLANDGSPAVRKISYQSQRRASNMDASYTAQFSRAVNQWSGYGLAALAVGLGLALSYMKS